jgi:hypothetical protein
MWKGTLTIKTEASYFPVSSFVRSVLLQAAAGAQLGTETLPIQRSGTSLQTGKDIYRQIAN